jgi:hypothetical protein
MVSRSTRSPVLGYSDRSTVKLDYDRVPLRIVKFWSRRPCDWFKLEGFIIFESSRNSFHVIYNRPVTWRRNMHIMCWIAVESQLGKLRDYVLMQGIKESSTLRVGPKFKKPSPRIVYRYGKQDKQIREFLEMRKTIDHISKNL